jgi:hypothetical protein
MVNDKVHHVGPELSRPGAALLRSSNAVLAGDRAAKPMASCMISSKA